MLAARRPNSQDALKTCASFATELERQVRKMTLNQQVHRFATSKIGQRVGSGECFDLADQALRNAGARSAADYGSVAASADYSWGRSIARAQATPGDIIQFRNFTFTIRTVTVTRVNTGGGGFDETTEESETSESRPHHTAIVDAVRSNGEISVLEQNVGTGSGRRKVQRNTLYFTNRTPPAQTTRRGNTTTTVTRSITVSGQVWFYRPQPRP